MVAAFARWAGTLFAAPLGGPRSGAEAAQSLPPRCPGPGRGPGQSAALDGDVSLVAALHSNGRHRGRSTSPTCGSQRPGPSRARCSQSRPGIALLIVVSVLTVVMILGVSFVFSMHLETQVARHFSSTAKARYVAEAGINHARALLDEDRLGSRIDAPSEPWGQQLAGGDVDIDGNGTNDAKWWSLDAGGADAGSDPTVGRYAVLIQDEAGKVNINTALADPDESGTDAPSLTQLLTRAGVPKPLDAAKAIEAYRLGDDARPGVASLDDDGDGAIDEPDEYQPLQLRGDDRRFETLEEVLPISPLEKAIFKRFASMATVYSWDANVSVTGKARMNLNTSTAEELLGVLLETGVAHPWELAANLADYADPDLSISRVSKVSSLLALSNQGDRGDWSWVAESGSNGHYETEEEDGQALEWSVTVPAGTAHVLVQGVSGTKVGDVTIAGQTKPSMDSGELFAVLDLSSTISVKVACREPAGTTCAFRGIELVADEARSGFTTVLVRGIEAVRINEVMVSPRIELPVSSAAFVSQASGWTCTGESCTNSGSGQARWTWTDEKIPAGVYHAWFYGVSSGQTIGEVRIGSATQTLTHGQRHSALMTVAADHEVTVTIGKTPADGTYSFGKVILSLEPDAEYVELINLSDRDIEVGGWLFEGPVVAGRQARIPFGTTIEAHGLLVAAVDVDDAASGLAANGISLSVWGGEGEATVVQLEFPGGGMSPDVDWLSDSVSGSATLTLRTGESVVDEVEYKLPLTVAPFQSLEKGDPSLIFDDDVDGIDDGWSASLKLYTPGAPNDNNALREVKGQQIVLHDPQEELTIRNRPLESLGQLAGLPSGTAWRPLAVADLAKVVDRLTVRGLRLESEGHLDEDEGGWLETESGYEADQAGVSGVWQWEDVPDGTYRLALYGWRGEQMALRWHTSPGSFGDWTPTLTADAQGRILAGQVEIGGDASDPGTLTVEVRCESPSSVCHLLHVGLDPELTVEGLININTAPLDVLLCLPGMTDAVAQRIISDRPFGDQDDKARGIGDLLLGSALGETDEDRLERFRGIAHLVTVRSRVFRLLSAGEAWEHERKTATQRIQAVVQR